MEACRHVDGHFQHQLVLTTSSLPLSLVIQIVFLKLLTPVSRLAARVTLARLVTTTVVDLD
jgi:hypothetical protein